MFSVGKVFPPRIGLDFVEGNVCTQHDSIFQKSLNE